VSRLTDQIKVVPTSSGNLFEISFRGTSPAVAQRVVEATVEMFAHAGAGDKKRDSQDAGRFIDDQIRGYDVRLTEAENRLKDFKLRNFGVSGVSNQDYFSRVSQLTEEVGKLRVELSAAERSRDAYRRELSTDEPQLPPTLARRVGGGAVALPEVEVRLEAQRKHLDDLLARYTEAHPDVISTRRIIGQLQTDAAAQREAEEGALNKLGRGARAAASPVYQQLRLSLAETEAQVASLTAQLGAQQARLDQVRALAGQVPQAEAELAQLNRDYDIVRKNYEAMIARRESASLGAKLDESAQLAEFRVIEPARVSPTPVFPSRVVLALGAVALCIALGVAVAVVADLLWPTFDDAAALRAESGRPVLGTVSMLLTPMRLQERRMNMLRFSGAFGLLLAMQVLWVVWIAARSPSA
jgi:polysaccharide chain length determinant protein (PEP-CTERM system associated)